MQKAKIKPKIEVSREFEDYAEKRFDIDKFNAPIECGSGNRDNFD